MAWRPADGPEMEWLQNGLMALRIGSSDGPKSPVPSQITASIHARLDTNYSCSKSPFKLFISGSPLKRIKINRINKIPESNQD